MESKLKDQEEKLRSLEVAKVSATNVADKLNKALTEQRKVFETEKKSIVKEYRNEVKAWKKELGEVNRKHINLQRKMDALQNIDTVCNSSKQDTYAEFETELHKAGFSSEISSILCSICAAYINDYIPEYFCGEIINAACDKCKRDANLLLEHQTTDPFSSFPEVLPPSLVSHWTPFNYSAPCVSSLSTMKAHHVLLEYPGDSAILMKEMMREFRLLMEEQSRKMEEGCKQS